VFFKTLIQNLLKATLAGKKIFMTHIEVNIKTRNTSHLKRKVNELFDVFIDKVYLPVVQSMVMVVVLMI